MKPNKRSALDARTALCLHIEGHWPGASESGRWPSILKGWWHSAQGCEERATLGNRREEPPTLKGLHRLVLQHAPTQALNATLSGLSASRQRDPRVARPSQTWAVRWNPSWDSE